jgi:hypothetical protein
VLAEIERKPQSWRQPIVVNRKDLITPPRHLDAANRRPSGVKRRRKHHSRLVGVTPRQFRTPARIA